MSDGATPAGEERNSLVEPSMWFFVFGEMWIFTAYFAVYMVDRRQHHALFLAAQHQLNPVIGIANTLILLASSWLLALAMRSVHHRDRTATSRLLAGCGLCGLAFLALKVLEYVRLVSHGMTITSSPFFMYFYLLTGLHLLHVLAGLGVLVSMGAMLRNVDLDVASMETRSAYWHMVDVVWLVLFAALYFVG
jgi:nitric oxide reductase NorE protein